MDRKRNTLLLCALVAVFCTLGSLTGYFSKAFKSKDISPQPENVVLSITDLTGGVIQGTVRCTDNLGRALVNDACLPWEQTLADAVFSCGPSIVTIDRSWTHVKYVSFPVKSYPEEPTNLEVVRCVQSKVGFGFSATTGLAGIPGETPGNWDDAPFRALHSSRPKR